MNQLIRWSLVSIAFLAASSFAQEPRPTQIRILSGNLSSGNKQSYENGEGLRIIQGLKADVVLLQEFNYKKNTETDIIEMVKEKIGAVFNFYRESQSTDQIPNGVISRFPILSSGEWDDAGMPNRDFAWAQLDIPGDRDLWAISVHLSASKSLVRRQQANDLVAYIKMNIPEKDYVALGGDFNITNRDDQIIGIFSEVIGEKSAPVDSRGGTTSNMTRKKNYDWILADNDLAQYQVPTRFVSDVEEDLVEGENVFTNGLVFDSTIFPKLDRIAPVEPSDSRAMGMQHLAIVKDFTIPGVAASDQPVDDDDCEPETEDCEQ